MANGYQIDAIWYPLTIPLNAPLLVNFDGEPGRFVFRLPLKSRRCRSLNCRREDRFLLWNPPYAVETPPTVAEVSGHGDA
jgi:hypothetical protein